MVFVITGSGTRIAESYEGSSSRAALLTIEYTIPGALSSSETLKSALLKNSIMKIPKIDTSV